MALVDATASADDDLLDEDLTDSIQTELNFRDEQLKKMSEEALDLDELSDGIVMSDFTLDYFFTQLLHYLEKNKAELEATPRGAYAVTTDEEENIQEGVIFVLRQTDTSTDKREKVASPIQPYYTVYVRANGDVRYGCAHARQVLELFESVAIGKTEPAQRLYDQFDSETQHGKDMNRYDKLLNGAMKHINTANSQTQVIGLAIGADRSIRIPAKPQGATRNFELVTWLVIFNKDAIA